MSSLIRNPQLAEQIFLLVDREEEARQHAQPIIQGYTEEELQAARAESFRDGSEAAWREIAPLKAELEEETRRAVASLVSLARELDQELAGIFKHSAQQVAHFAFEIARVVVRHEIAASPETIVPLVRETLERAAAAERILVRVSPRDHSFLKQDPMLLAEATSFASVKLRPDSNVEDGGCVVESEQGNWDARIDTQLTRLGNALNEARTAALAVEAPSSSSDELEEAA